MYNQGTYIACMDLQIKYLIQSGERDILVKSGVIRKKGKGLSLLSKMYLNKKVHVSWPTFTYPNLSLLLYDIW